MSSLQVAADEYVAIRRSTGFKFEQAANLLSDFVRHLESDGSRVITSTAAISWASAVGGHPNWWGKRLSVVRGFARYLHGLEPDHEVPPTGLFPTRPCRATPYLYSDDDVAGLMVAARSLRASWGRTMETLIGLLASTGMRVGEAIHLDVTDIDWAGGVLVVRSTKFGKSREVALHATTVDALLAYHDERHRMASQLMTTTFFVSTLGGRLRYDSVHATFHRLVVQLGLPRLTEHHGPRLHDYADISVMPMSALNQVQTERLRVGITTSSRTMAPSRRIGGEGGNDGRSEEQGEPGVDDGAVGSVCRGLWAGAEEARLHPADHCQ